MHPTAYLKFVRAGGKAMLQQWWSASLDPMRKPPEHQPTGSGEWREVQFEGNEEVQEAAPSPAPRRQRSRDRE